MLDDQQILNDIHALPPEKQAEVLDFIAFVAFRARSSVQAGNAFPSAFQLTPASHPSGFTHTSVDHDVVFAQAALDSSS